MKILEVTEFDLYGRGFNGYDIMKRINCDTNHCVHMMALRKVSKDSDVLPILKSEKQILLSDELRYQENNYLNIMSVLSVSSPALYSSKEYASADIVHYHQFHNSNFGFFELEREARYKPTVISFHDPWMMTGRCVHPRDCKKYIEGCGNCGRLDTLFPFKSDMSAAMWKIKRDALSGIDADIIVHSDYMYSLVKENPYTKNLNVHLIPFGIDVSEFDLPRSKEESRKLLGIPPNDFVFFFRAQSDFKGTSYIVEALKKFDDTKNITLLTCSQTGLLEEISGRYNIVELGNIHRETVKECFNACDIFLMPSIGESFGMMALEAMAAARPVVVFDNTALPQVTGAPDVGVLVKNLDSEDLYRKIKHLMENKDERISRGLKGRKLAVEKYSSNEYNRRIIETYKSAYNRQKYKLWDKPVTICADAFKDDVEVGKLFYHLNAVFLRAFPYSAAQNVPFPDISIRECSAEEIDYENENVKKAVIAFNEQCYRNMISKKTFIFFKIRIKSFMRSVLGFLKRLVKRFF